MSQPPARPDAPTPKGRNGSCSAPVPAVLLPVLLLLLVLACHVTRARDMLAVCVPTNDHRLCVGTLPS